ncbi:MAG: L-2-hydroxyglutarate oxidase [Actinomycetota bacterium]
MAERYDIAIVGAGIVGLATALRLLERRPALRIAVIDKEDEVGFHQTGHNSGVIHSAISYRPGSLKARLALEGKAALERFCDEHDIPFERCGKLVVATREEEIAGLEQLMEQGTANGVTGLRLVTPDGFREIEPCVRAIRALHVPGTAIVDMRRIALAMEEELRQAGADVLLGRSVRSIRSTAVGPVLETSGGPIEARSVVVCGGLQSDRLAAAAGEDDGSRIVPFRGDYAVLVPRARHLVRGLVYPVADPSLPFLGVHATRRIDGEVWLGPNAVLALARERYRRLAFDPADALDVVRFRGTWRVARRWWRVGVAEQWRDVSRRAFLRAARRFLPELDDRDVAWGPVGIRAQLVAADGTLLDDFVLRETPHVLHVRNAPSPAATASLAIGSEIATRALERLDA